MMPALLDFWFDFASTYSYPAAMRVAPLAWQSGVMVRFRPFLLGPLFKAQGWSTSPFNLYPAKGRYMWRDLERICFDLDSAVSAARTLSTKQLVGCARCVGWIEELMGRGVLPGRFSSPVRGRSSDRRSDHNPRYTLTASHRSCSSVRKAAQAETNKAALRTQTGEAKQLGIFGAPTFATADGELFWGNDRLERAIAWARMGVDPIATD
jgi:2-hydroxychromene-2-carboxylate isomerase